MTYSRPIQTAVSNGTTIATDLAAPLGPVPVKLVATAAITLLRFGQDATLTRPFLDGSEIAKGVDNGTYQVSNGQTFSTYANEAAALISAGVATAA